MGVEDIGILDGLEIGSGDHVVARELAFGHQADVLAIAQQGVDGADGLDAAVLDANEAALVREVGDGLGIQGVPAADDHVLVKGGIGHVALGLVHVDHQVALGICLLARLEVLRELLDLDVVA